MIPQELKYSILDLAIRGKLVPQIASEGDGNDLYKKIKISETKEDTKKARGKGKSQILSVEDDFPFDIPDSWKWVRLGAIGYTNIGLTYSPKDVSPKGTVVLRSSNIQNGKMDYEDIVAVQMDVPENKMCHVGDILICARNGSKRLVGKAAIIDREGMSFGAFMAIFRSCCNEYVIHVINSVYFRNSLLGGTGTTTINQITQDMLKNVLIPLPPLAEQKRIVAKIEELLPYIDRYEQAWSKLEDFNKRFPVDMQKSILQMAIQGKLVEQRLEEGTSEELYQQIQTEKQRLIKEGKIKKEKPLPEITEDDVPFDIPENWAWVRIGAVASVLGGKRIPAGRRLTTENTGYVYIRVSDMKEGYVSTDNLQYVPTDIYPTISRYIINKEDVFITVAGTIGRVGKIPPELDGANLTENADRLVFTQMDQDWFIKCLQSSVVQRQITDATTKVGQPKLAIARIQNMIIPLPPLAEQKRIVTRLEELLPLCERLK